LTYQGISELIQMRHHLLTLAISTDLLLFVAFATPTHAQMAVNVTRGNVSSAGSSSTAVAASGPAAGQHVRLRGEPAAISAAERILEIAGGRDVWSRHVLATEQNLYLRTGETGKLRIWRDLHSGIRRFERLTESGHLIEILSPNGGWRSVNGVVEAMSVHELAVGLQGLKQEPYTLYHRIAKRDPALRFELRDNGLTLMVFDGDERVLSWFSLDSKQGVVGWGSHYNGNVNQHYYGPIERMGNVRLPKFGVASNGAFRFEYTKGEMLNTPVELPDFARR
jgi:hypothetical protein